MSEFVEAQHPRDERGRFGSGGSGLGAWASRKAKGDAPGKVIGEAKSQDRVWTDELPKGMKKESWMAHFDKHPDQGGKPSAERDEKVHQPLIHAALDNVKPVPKGEEKIAIMTMGAPASGKSSMLHGIDESKFVKVDPDDVKGKLPEYKQATQRGSTFRGAAAMVHEESSYIAKKILQGAIDQGKHVIVDGTGSNAESMMKKMENLKKAGYHVHLMYAHLGDADEGVRRINARADKSGRYVPEQFARQAYHDIPRNFEKIASKADSFAVHDSSREGSPTVWEKTADGREMQRDPSFVTNFKVQYRKKDT